MVAYFDFAVNEQCFEYEECEALKPFTEAGKAIFNAEYKEEYVQDESVRKSLCKQALALRMSTLILPLELDDSFRFSCL